MRWSAQQLTRSSEPWCWRSIEYLFVDASKRTGQVNVQIIPVDESRLRRSEKKQPKMIRADRAIVRSRWQWERRRSSIFQWLTIVQRSCSDYHKSWDCCQCRNQWRSDGYSPTRTRASSWRIGFLRTSDSRRTVHHRWKKISSLTFLLRGGVECEEWLLNSTTAQ